MRETANFLDTYRCCFFGQRFRIHRSLPRDLLFLSFLPPRGSVLSGVKVISPFFLESHRVPADFPRFPLFPTTSFEAAGKWNRKRKEGSILPSRPINRTTRKIDRFLEILPPTPRANLPFVTCPLLRRKQSEAVEEGPRRGKGSKGPGRKSNSTYG